MSDLFYEVTGGLLLMCPLIALACAEIDLRLCPQDDALPPDFDCEDE